MKSSALSKQAKKIINQEQKNIRKKQLKILEMKNMAGHEIFLNFSGWDKCFTEEIISELEVTNEELAKKRIWRCPEKKNMKEELKDMEAS